jgi:hypothetical protein
MEEDVLDIAVKYDSVCMMALINIYTLTKDHANIDLINFNWNNDEHKFVFAVIVATQSTLGDKPIYVDVPWYVRNYLNKKYKKVVGAIKKVPRKNEDGVNVQELLDIMRGGAKEIVGPNFNFGDIYHAYYA